MPNESDAPYKNHGYFDMSSKGLVNSIVENVRPNMPHNAALAEMQRRLLDAICDFNRQSGRQARVMIGLTWAIAALTLLIGVLTVAMLVKGGA